MDGARGILGGSETRFIAEGLVYVRGGLLVLAHRTGLL